MGTLFGATFPIISKRVGGEGGLKHGKDVTRINQLLRLARLMGPNVIDDSVWSKESGEALKTL